MLLSHNAAGQQLRNIADWRGICIFIKIFNAALFVDADINRRLRARPSELRVIQSYVFFLARYMLDKSSNIQKHILLVFLSVLMRVMRLCYQRIH